MSHRTFIVAEISANHGNSLITAKETIKAAKEAGADAVKIQTYTADTMTIECDNEYFRINHDTIWDGTTLYELYKKAYTPWEWHKELFDYAAEIGIEIFSTPFDSTSVDFLETLQVKRYKIASCEITDLPLIEYAASMKKPMIISIGVATLNEIEEAINVCRQQGNDDITLLQCTVQYPANIFDANLLVMGDIRKRFNVKSGLSDHTKGHVVAAIATAMQASIIEKHFIVDRSIGGPDASFSMNADEFKEMVEYIRNTERIMGTTNYEFDENKEKSRTFVRSLFVTKDVKKGEKVSPVNVRSIRPGYGISPKYLKDLIGKEFIKDVEKGTPMAFNLVK